MEIQKILFPEVGRCTEQKLYFRTNKKVSYLNGEKKIQLNKNYKVKFDTYFNGLSIEKWKKYTRIADVFLCLKLQGSFKVTLLAKEKIHEDVIEKIVSEQIVSSDSIKEFEFPYKNIEDRGMFTFEIVSMRDGSSFYGGYYATNINEDQLRTVKIGIAICTFRRESFIENNLRILNASILENQESELNQHLEVFISDNGKTLDINRLSSQYVHIYPNKNLGGAGGFTRDLIEIMTQNEQYQITHALLMDDDIVIEPEAIEKTYRILTLLKDEYVDAFIGGAMLRRDKQSIQVEAGASWNGGYLNSLKHNLNLNKLDACLYNEVEEYTEFNAWWYCCFPMKIVTPDNLPLPIFIRGDDLEYGLRNMKNLILMNGICVWHEPFENKYSSFLEYYIMRNQLIDNSFHCPWYKAKHLRRAIFGHCMREITFYRYKNVTLYLQGIKDFLKGPKWLMQQDGEALHKSVMDAGYKAQDLDTLDIPFEYAVYEDNCCNKDTTSKKILRMLSLNGILLPAKGTNIVPMAMARPALFYRKKRVMQYDVTSKKAFITEKSFGKSIACILKSLGMMWIVTFKLKGAQKKYRTEGLELRTLDYWKKYLEI